MFDLSVHPRACGERSLLTGVRPASFGSSPRVRGTGEGRVQGGGVSRFIPARAGNGTIGPGWPGGRPVHPRACGERGRPRHYASGHNGSSPRVRGTVGVLISEVEVERFIPARAGNG